METDELIQKIINPEFQDCIVLIIVHSLNTIVNFDRLQVSLFPVHVFMVTVVMEADT